MQDKLPIETVLGNFANAAQTIERMEEGEKIGFCPAIGCPRVLVICQKGSGTGDHRQFTVNGVDVGNSHGAVSALVYALTPSLADALQGAPLRREDEDPRGYYAQLRGKLLATLEPNRFATDTNGALIDTKAQ